MNIGVLLINLGTPDSPSKRDVRRYLTEFLNDPLVMDVNPAWRFFLVNFIIVPFRAKKSAELYQKIWTNEGSPLLIHTRNLAEKMQKALGENYAVEFAMRYQKPSIDRAFKKFKEKNIDEIIAVPLYPQYAISSTGSTIEELKRIMKNEKFAKVRIIEHFYRQEGFLNACAEIGKKYLFPDSGYDFFVFSYHGLPERQVTRVYPDHCKINSGCCSTITEKNHLCYRAACFETTRQLVNRLQIPEGKYITSFQSRLDDKWLKPYSDEVVKDLAKKGNKNLLVFSPAFVADCLETIYEIGVEYEEIFKKHGGEKLTMVESLNDNEMWVEALKEIISE